MVQPGTPLDGPAAAGAGKSPKPSAHSIEISIRITRVRIGDKAYLSMKAGLQSRKWPRALTGPHASGEHFDANLIGHFIKEESMTDRQSLPRLLYTRDAATILGVSAAWLERRRWQGLPPPYVRSEVRRVARFDTAKATSSRTSRKIRSKFRL